MDDLLASIFYDKRTGFGSIEDTYRAAKARDPTINKADVRAWIKKQEVRQRRKPVRVNSYVAMFPRQEFQVDLLDMGKLAKPRYGFVCIDIFSKKGACLPIKQKTSDFTAEAMNQCFQDLGYPVCVMSDEGGEFAGSFDELLKNEEVEHVRSRTGGRFVERFIRTLKKPIKERREALGGRWADHVQDVVDKYNETIHRSTGMSPHWLAENEYDFDEVHLARRRMLAKAKFPVKHPEIFVGDFVKVRVKPSEPGDYKETFRSWTPEVYTVERIEQRDIDGQNVYHLRGYKRPLLRFELLKVEDVQRFKNGQLTSALQDVRRPRPEPAAEPAEPEAPPRRRLIPIREEPRFDDLPPWEPPPPPRRQRLRRIEPEDEEPNVPLLRRRRARRIVEEEPAPVRAPGFLGFLNASRARAGL